MRRSKAQRYEIRKAHFVRHVRLVRLVRRKYIFFVRHTFYSVHIWYETSPPFISWRSPVLSSNPGQEDFATYR